MNLARTSLSALIAAAATLAMPLAFAQTAPTTGDASQSAPAAQPAPAAAPSSTPKQVTWADLDSDKDGNLSKQEVTTVPSLSQVFDQADTDKDGKLTADEYKTFAAANSGGASATGSGSGK